MNHLSAHLRRSGSHDGLPFHPDCPACVRERMRGSTGARPLLPASARAGLTAIVLAASAAHAATRSTDPASAQTDTAPSVDETPQMVSPEELDEQLADPNRDAPKADEQGREDSHAGARKGGTYVVQPGDSLWHIAHTHLGGDPSNARIAREVSRLWALNNVAIGTGDPDLILVGQRLKLR